MILILVWNKEIVSILFYRNYFAYIAGKKCIPTINNLLETRVLYGSGIPRFFGFLVYTVAIANIRFPEHIIFCKNLLFTLKFFENFALNWSNKPKNYPLGRSLTDKYKMIFDMVVLINLQFFSLRMDGGREA